MAAGGHKGGWPGIDFICVLSGTAIEGSYIKIQGKAGSLGARLMAVVAEGDRSRLYLHADFRA